VTAPGDADHADDEDPDAPTASDARDTPEAPPPTVPIDPHGDDPEHIPDPMPSDLQRSKQSDHAFEASEPMEGEAPTG
jgi:hypothetical protein